MVEDGGEKAQSAEEWLLRTQALVLAVIENVNEAKGDGK